MSTVNISVLQLSQLFAGGAMSVGRSTEHALRTAARAVQEEARGMLGTYQVGNAQFQTWPELADSTKEERFDLGFPENEPLLRNGELRDHILYEIELNSFHGGEAVVGVPSVTVGDGSKQNPFRDIGDIAMWQEMGTDHIPSRSFLGLSAARLSPHIARLFGHAMCATIVGDPQEATVQRLDILDITP